MPLPRRPAALLAALAALAACGGVDDPPPDPCAAAPGPGWLAYASRRAGNYDVRLVSPDDACDRALTDDPADDLAPSFSVAANAVAFAGHREGRQVVVVHDLASGTERVLDTGALAAANPAISPDGSTVAFEGRAGEGPPDVYVVPIGGGTPAPVAAAGAVDGGPAWSDDATLCFLSDRTSAGNFEVWRVRTDGTALEPLTSYATRAAGTGSIMGKAAVSPDGLEIAFARTTSDGSRVVVRTLSAGLAPGAERILAPQIDADPSFDPAGGAIAVSTWEDGEPEVVVRRLADGATLRRVTGSASAEGAPAFAR